MTYPPQQPPGPPGPYGPQDPYGQQQPQYGQQPYGQQPQYGQQQPYGQQYGQQWGGQPGYPAPEPKKKTGLIATLIIVAILVLGGGGAALYFFVLKDNGSDPRAVADDYVSELSTAVSTKVADVDLAPLKPLACEKDYKQLSEALEAAKKENGGDDKDPAKKSFAVANFSADGENATFDMTVTAAGKKPDPNDKLSMKVQKEGDHLVVCGLSDGGGAPSGGDTADDTTPTSGSDETSTSDDGGDGGNGGSIPNPIPKTS